MKLTQKTVKMIVENVVADLTKVEEAQVYHDEVLTAFDDALTAIETLGSVMPASEPVYNRLVAVVDELEKIHTEYNSTQF
jgi:hypothetical protein